MNTFFDEIQKLIDSNPNILSDEAIEYFYDLQSTAVAAAPKIITEKGAAILKFLQSVPNKNMTSKMIGDAMGLNARSVSGSMRRLVNDGFVTAIGKNPIVYMISDKGLMFDLSTLDNTENL